MYFTIIKQDGTEVKTEEHNMKVLKFNKSFPTMRHETEVLDERDGFIDMGTYYESRTMSATVLFTAADNLDAPLIQNEIFRIFDSREYFYLIDSREPGKRWKTKCETSFSPDQRTATFGTFDISFLSQPYAESVGTTLDPFTFDSGLWQIGQGLIESNQMVYRHSATKFYIYNAGEPIDARADDLEITFTGASDNLKIENITTGDVWTYSGTTAPGDVVLLKGVRSLKNGTTIFRDTNRKLITLNNGFNNFTIEGATGEFEITFKFRFKYL